MAGPMNGTPTLTSQHWSFSSGTGATSTMSRIASGGPQNEAFMRQSWTVAQTVIGNAGMLYSSGVVDPGMAASPGNQATGSVWVRSSIAQRIALYIQYMSSTSTTLLSTNASLVVVPNTWTEINLNSPGTAPEGTIRVRALAYSIVGTGGVSWPAGATLDVTGLEVYGISKFDPAPVPLVRPVAQPPKKWRYIAQNILTGEFTHWDLPLKRDELTWELSGPGVLRGTIDPEMYKLGIIEPWQTAIYAEADDEIRWGGILQNPGFNGPAFSFDCAGFTSYASDVPYMGPDRTLVNADPSQLFMDIWAHLQTQPDGNLGLIIRRPQPVPVRVGTAEEPYVLNNDELPDCGQELASLASETPFDYVEQHSWAGYQNEIDHTVTIAYPRIGRKRVDLAFTTDANIVSVVPVTRDGAQFANTIYGIGKGEGSAMVRAEVVQRDGHLRRPKVYTNKLANTKARLTEEAREQFAKRSMQPEIASITVKNHPHAPIGSWTVGDDILVRATLPWVGFVTIWCRIISWSLLGEETATLNLVRSDAYAYKPPEAPEPPEAVQPPPATPVLNEWVMTFNTHRDSADEPGHDWDSNNRKTQAIAAINFVNASLWGAQECTPNQAADIHSGCGVKSVYTGNVRIFYKPAVWRVSSEKKYVLDASADDRRLMAATFTHVATGKVVRVGNTHLTNLDNGPGSSVDGWRLKQLRQCLEYEPRLDIFFGDFNSESDVYKLAKQLTGLEQSRNKTSNHTNGTLSTSHHGYSTTATNSRWIDGILTRSNIRVISDGVVDTDGGSSFPHASDHNPLYAQIGM